MHNNELPLEVQKKLARLEAFTELNPRPIILIDFKGNVLDINPSARKLFPTLQSEGAKHPYLAHLKEAVAFLKKEKKPFRKQLEIGGELFKQIFYYVPNFKLIHIYGSYDISRKEFFVAIKESERRYHMLFEKMNYGYALQDIIFDKNKKPVDYRFVDVNPAFERLANLKKDHIIGKTANQISSQNQTQENKKTRKAYDNVALTGKPIYFETYNEKSKKYFDFYAYKPNKNQVALIFSDITQRKKTDEEKNNFISIMSHELRNPLTPIMANAQFIKSLLKKEPANPMINESIDIIEKQAKIMADLLNDILDVSRLSRKKIQLKKSKINICEVIKNSVATCMPFINTKSQTLSVFFGQDPIYMQADPLRIEQIIVNVINNASKYTKTHGQIEVHAGIKQGTIEIRVKDNGIGMSPEKMTRIFELFNDESQPFMGIGGLGIGLNIVRNLVSMHQGTVLVTSKGENKGSEFVIRFPYQARLAPTKKPALLKKEIPAKNYKTYSKILVVDDNEDIKNAISNMLIHEGYQVKSANTGLLAVKISKTFNPNTALIDIGLPDISGYKVAKMLREQQGKHKKIKLIASTGYGQEKDRKLSKEAGFDYHLTKPIDFNQLIKLI